MIANESVRNENAVVFLDRPTTHRSGVPARRAPRSPAKVGRPLGGSCGIPSRIVTARYIKSNADAEATSALPGAMGDINQ